MLFDLELDPLQKNDISKQQKEITQELFAFLSSSGRIGLVLKPEDGGGNGQDSEALVELEALAELEALGYLQ